MLKETSFEIGRRSLRVAIGPDNGPPLLFLHGVVRRWQDWLALTPTFSQRFQVHCLDFRGHGESDRTPGEYLVVDYVRDVTDYLRSLDRPAILFGHSLGAMVAAAAAAEVPERTRGLILEDPPFETLATSVIESHYYALFEGYRELAALGLGVRDLAARLAVLPIGVPGQPGPVPLGKVRDAASLRFMAKCLASMDPDVLTPLLGGRWLQGYDRDSILARVRAPSLLLQGNFALGGMLADADANRVTELLGDCTRVRMPETGHHIHQMETESAIRHALAFLESF